MTGLDLGADALIEVAALVTDFDLNVLGEGIDVIIKPPQEALDQMVEFVRTMHEKSGLLDELDSGTDAGRGRGAGAGLHQGALPRRQPPAARPATPSPPTAPSSPATCPTLESFLHYRIVDVSSIKELVAPLVPPRLLRRARPSAATTAPWPTSRRASRSCATTARRSSCPQPGPDSAQAKEIAARHGGRLTGLGDDTATPDSGSAD